MTSLCRDTAQALVKNLKTQNACCTIVQNGSHHAIDLRGKLTQKKFDDYFHSINPAQQQAEAVFSTTLSYGPWVG
jgi:hypothetical protein